MLYSSNDGSYFIRIKGAAVQNCNDLGLSCHEVLHGDQVVQALRSVFNTGTRRPSHVGDRTKVLVLGLQRKP